MPVGVPLKLHLRFARSVVTSISQICVAPDLSLMK